MSKIVSLSVNVDKIDKTKLVKGEKGTYLNLTLNINDEKDTYGNDGGVWQGQTKEERESKTDRNYLGNCKVVWEGKSTPQPVSGGNATTDDLPF